LTAAIHTIAFLTGASLLAVLMRRQFDIEHWLVRNSAASVKGSRWRLEDALAQIEDRLSATTTSREDNPVTGLPQRDAFCDALAARMATDARQPFFFGAIRFLDFDRLASFDQCGANEALRQFSLRLRQAARANHLVGHLERDCLGISFALDTDLEAAAAEFRALVRIAGQDFEGITPTVRSSAVRFPDDGTELGQLIAMVQAALSGPERIGARSGAVAEQLRDEFELEQDLSRAIADQQLTTVFQPIINLREGRIAGAETLLRWRHPRRGEISPALFIPVVEAIGLSDAFGLWVLDAACREARRWRDEGFSDLKVAVNLSARQLVEGDLRAKVQRTLERHRLDPQALELELTETAAMENSSRTSELFGSLRELGVSLAIDDFGAGYSSLSYLKNLPFQKLKIDREFITSVDTRKDSRAICSALIELGRGLGLTVLAEGVETAAEVETLLALGCDVFQGYFLSKPLSGDDFRALVKSPLNAVALHTRALPEKPAQLRVLSA